MPHSDKLNLLGSPGSEWLIRPLRALVYEIPGNFPLDVLVADDGDFESPPLTCRHLEPFRACVRRRVGQGKVGRRTTAAWQEEVAGQCFVVGIGVRNLPSGRRVKGFMLAGELDSFGAASIVHVPKILDKVARIKDEHFIPESDRDGLFVLFCLPKSPVRNLVLT